MKRKLYFVFFAICMCLGFVFVSCSDEDETLDFAEKRLVGTYLSGVNDLTVGKVELKSNKTGASWRELNNTTHLPVSEKSTFTWSATYDQITFKGGSSPYNTTYKYTYAGGIVHLESGNISINWTKY